MTRLLVGVFAVVCMLLALWVGTSSEPVTQELPSTKKPGQLAVGFGSRDITPEVGADKPPVYLAGFGQNRVARSINDRLYAHAIVLSDGTRKIALVTVDLVGLFYANALHIREGVTGYHGVVVSSTHNHEGPDTMGMWGPTPIKSGIDPAYLKRVEQAAIAAIQEAESKLAPATAKFGKALAPQLLHDSREPYILHDELYCLKFESPTGQPLAMLVNWHCHPETLAGENTSISADYVGYCRDELKKLYQCPVAYFTGTVGGLMTSLHVKVRDEQGTLLPENSLAKTMAYGKQLAQVARQAMNAATPVTLTPLRMKSQVIYVPMTNQIFRAGRTMGILDRDAYRWQGNPLKPGEKLASRLAAGEMALQSEVSVLKLGDVQIACIPGEIYPEIVLGGVPDTAESGADYPSAAIEPYIYTSLPGQHKMLFGLANDEIGYIIPKRQWDEKPPYCYGRKKSQYGEVNSCGPETAAIICETIKTLAK